jgi:hypothetical protein
MESIDNNKNKNTSILKNQLEECILSSSTHGLSNIYQSKSRLNQLLWILMVILSSCVCIYFIIISLTDYFSYSVTTETRILNEHHSLFPVVTICNKNIFTSDESVEYLKQLIREKNLIDFFNETSFISDESISTQEKYNSLFYFIRLARSNLLKDNQNMSKYSQPLEKILISCDYAGLKCDSNDFDLIYNSIYGNCFQFNSGRNRTIRKMTKLGKFNGLTLELYVGLSDELNKLALNKGLFVSISNQTDYPFDYLPNSFDIQSGLETNIQVERFVYNQLPQPYSKCNLEITEMNNINAFDSDFYRTMLSTNYSYSRESCLDICYQIYLNESCNCFDYSVSFRFPDMKICHNKQQFDCTNNFYYNKFILNDFIDVNCLKKCPMECTKMKFNNYLSYSTYPSDFYVNSIRNEKTFSKYFSMNHKNDFDMNLKNNLVKLNVFYDSLSLVTLKESPTMTIIDLFSSIGGTLGLFLGMSILSFIEFIEIFLIYLKIKIL